MVEVVTTWTPRPLHTKWRTDYPNMFRIQRLTVLQAGHTYTVITDDKDFTKQNTLITPLITELPKSFMAAMIYGVVYRLRQPVETHLLFADVDVLINQNLEPAFDGTFDLGLTRRINEVSPINNGAMYVDKDGASKALTFFEGALERCGDKDHWGADQEAISQQAAPVPEENGVEDRGYIRIAFLDMRKYSAVPKIPNMPHDINPYCIHFKGETPKNWLDSFAINHVLK